MAQPRIIVSVTSDLVTDQRVHRSCMALKKQGFEVLLVGRKLPASIPLKRNEYKTKRFQLLFHKGPMFYALYNIRLFIFLMLNRSSALMSNDLDTLPANFLVSRIKRIPLLYDSHEFYTGVPELVNRPLVRKIWSSIEKFIFPKLKKIITVNESIATLYKELYGKNLVVIRNVPLTPALNIPVKDKKALRQELRLPTEGYLLILQGSGINIQRGAEEAVEAMQFIENATLIILGGGDVLPVLKEKVLQLKLDNKILFLEKRPYVEMMKITSACDIGLTLDKDTNINYRFSLPNKIFDYLHAGLAVLASKLPEVEKVIDHYKAGTFVENHQPEHIAERISFMISDEAMLAQWQKNAQFAATELNWEIEEQKFPKIIHERF